MMNPEDLTKVSFIFLISTKGKIVVFKFFVFFYFLFLKKLFLKFYLKLFFCKKNLKVKKSNHQKSVKFFRVYKKNFPTFPRKKLLHGQVYAV
jgi:hypothetical protein